MTEPTVPVEIPSERENGNMVELMPDGPDGKPVVTDAARRVARRQMVYWSRWSQDRVLAPIPDEHGLFMPQWRRNILLLDQGFNPKSKRVFPGVDAYFDRFRLTFRAEGAVPGFVDSTGAAHAFPDGVVGFRQLRVEARHPHAFGPDRTEREAWLVFRDAAGRVLLLLPAYGWSFTDQLKPWADAVGWASESGWAAGQEERRFMEDLEADYPGINTCPFAACGGPLVTAADRAAGRRVWRR